MMMIQQILFDILSQCIKGIIAIYCNEIAEYYFLNYFNLIETHK